VTDIPSGDPSPGFCDYEGSDYRTRFWEGQGRDYEDLAERSALQRLLPTGGARIIDIGGGFGRLVDLYSGYREVVLMDYSRSLLQEAQARCGAGRIIYVAANLYQMPFRPASFDTAVIVRVLHHLSDVPQAFAAIHHILQPGATLVLEYANKRHLKAILRRLLRRGAPNPFDPRPHQFASFNFNFHPTYIEHGLQDAGFVLERQLAASHFRIEPLKRIVSAHTLAMVDSWLQGPTARLKLTPSMFLRSHAVGEPSTPSASTIFCCPRCHGQLQPDASTLQCTDCGSRWNTTGGIYDFKEPL